MANRIKAFGTLLEVENAAQSAYVTIAALQNQEGPGGDTEEIDGTAHDSPSGFRELLPSFKDLGEVTFNGFFDPDDVSHNEANADGVFALYKSSAIRAMRIVIPGTTIDELQFTGFIKSFRLTTPHDGLVGFNCTIRATGVPVLV